MSSPKDRQKKANKTTVKAAVRARAAASPVRSAKAKVPATQKSGTPAKTLAKAAASAASKSKLRQAVKLPPVTKSEKKAQATTRATAAPAATSPQKTGKPTSKTSQVGTVHKANGKVLANNEPQSLGKRPTASDKLFKLLPGTGVIMTKSTQPKNGTKGGSEGKGGQNGRSAVVLPPGYRPSEAEPFMNERQRVYFRGKLIAWKEEIVRQNMETLHGLHEDSSQHADLADRATSETDRALELRARDRQRKLVAKIDAALARIEEGTYGYCEETGEPISLKRLDARPIATMSIEAQERHERREKVYREE